MRRNFFFIISGGVYLILAVLLSMGVLNGMYWVILTPDTAKIILGTVMGVSGSIIGFLVIYLSLALDGMKRNYGKHAVELGTNEPQRKIKATPQINNEGC